MKFLKLCDNVLKQQKLQKVRVKIDPIWASSLGIYDMPCFEGYILQECSPEFKIFIVNVPPGIDPVQSVKEKDIEPINEPDQEIIPKGNYSKLTLLKKAILDKVIELGKQKEDPEVLQVLNSKDIGFIETYLRQMGLTEEDLLNLYRKCFKKV